MKIRLFFVQFALAFALLLSQQLGIAHAISHLSSDAPSSGLTQKQLPGETQCSQCLAFAAIDFALDGQPVAFYLPLPVLEAPLEAPSSRHFSSLIRAFDSRAPPLVLQH